MGKVGTLASAHTRDQPPFEVGKDDWDLQLREVLVAQGEIGRRGAVEGADRGPGRMVRPTFVACTPEENPHEATVGVEQGPPDA